MPRDARGPRGGCASHFLFEKKKMRRARWKRKNAGAKRRRWCLFRACTRGPRKRLWVETFSQSVWRGPRPRNLHILRFRLTPKAHSFRCSSSPPRKPLRWVFAWAPVLLKLTVFRPRRTTTVRQGCKTDLTFSFPPLPLCSACGKSALSEAGSAEREAETIR